MPEGPAFNCVTGMPLALVTWRAVHEGRSGEVTVTPGMGRRSRRDRAVMLEF